MYSELSTYILKLSASTPSPIYPEFMIERRCHAASPIEEEEMPRRIADKMNATRCTVPVFPSEYHVMIRFTYDLVQICPSPGHYLALSPPPYRLSSPDPV